MDLIEQSKKLSKQITMKTNKITGIVKEKSFEAIRKIEGYELHRTGVGSDYSEQKVDLLSGEKGPKVLVEVKSSQTAPLSPLQKENQKKLGPEKFRVERSSL